MKLTIETDDPIKMKCLVVLAEILIKSETSSMAIFEAAEDFRFFLDNFRMYIMGADQSTWDIEGLLSMSNSMQNLVNVMRATAEENEEIAKTQRIGDPLDA